MTLEEQAAAQLYVKENSVWVPFCGCWLWTLSLDTDGYPVSSRRFGILRAHRLAYAAFKGKILKELYVLLTCDTPGCVNPDHLWLGTNDDNMADMVRKGRAAIGDKNGSRTHPEKLSRGVKHYSRIHPEKMARGDKHYSRIHSEKMARGERNGFAKLTEEKVRRIFQLHEEGFTQKQIGEIVGCSQATVNLILRKERWKHVVL